MNNNQNVEIDWSKAPAAATHYDTHYALFCTQHGFWDTCGDWTPHKTQSMWGTPRYTPRPTTNTQPAWDGEGLPPVGVVCEVFRCRSWVECKVFAHAPSGDRVDVLFTFTYEDGVQDWSYEDSNDLRFMRPIKSPKQIAAEEREKAIEEISDDLGIGQYIASKMYDKGYRKPEQTK